MDCKWVKGGDYSAHSIDWWKNTSQQTNMTVYSERVQI